MEGQGSFETQAQPGKGQGQGREGQGERREVQGKAIKHSRNSFPNRSLFFGPRISCTMLFRYPSLTAEQESISSLDLPELIERLQSGELKAAEVLEAFTAKAVQASTM